MRRPARLTRLGEPSGHAAAAAGPSAAAAGQSPAEVEIRPLSAAEFRLFQRLIYSQAGIALGPSKKELLVARLRRRLRALGIRSFRDYHRLVEHDAEERVRMLDCISTNETRFFREPRQFEFLEQQILPDLRAAGGHRPGSLRVWSAGCSTGEEPYSLAMTLLDQLPDWQVEILATDLSTRVLQAAREALWPIEKSAEIPFAYRKRFMLRGIRRQGGKMKAGPEIRSLIRFARLNLNDLTYPPMGQFQLIFCRNVLIYFDADSRQRVIRRLLDRLTPSGVLFLGHAESLSGLDKTVRSVGPNIYTHAQQAPWPGATAILEHDPRREARA